MGKSNEAAGTKNRIEALRREAEAGDASAANRLGDYYFDGIGVDKDLVQAVDWYRRSAEAGNASARLRLSLCFLLGVGCKQDIQAARFWRRKWLEVGGEEILRKIPELGDGR